MSNSKEIILAAELSVDQEQGVVSLTITEADTATELTEDSIKASLTALDASDWSLDSQAMEDALRHFSSGHVGQHLIGKRVDASFKVTLSPDDMKATIECHPAMGGKPINIDAIRAKLESKSVNTKCIKDDIIDTISEITEHSVLVIARGQPPKPGKNSYFEKLINDIEDIPEPSEDDYNNIDFLAGKTYLTVAAGDLLMRRLPPTKGLDGYDVFGRVVTATDGKEIPFSKDLMGTQFADDDPNLLIAKDSGHPVLCHDGVRVDKTMNFENVDITVGHVTFDGSINVTGDVSPNIKIDVTGDVFIKGMVERAFINAGNNVTVSMGITGDTNDELVDGLLPEIDCVIKAGGSIQARYANLANLTAEKDIVLREYSFNSNLNSKEKILLGQQGGNGKIVGGNAKAGLAIIAKSVGSDAYIHTHLSAGASAAEVSRTKTLKINREEHLEQARVLRRLLNEITSQDLSEPLNSAQLEKAKKIHHDLLDLQAKINAIVTEYRDIKFTRLSHAEPIVKVTKNSFPNSFITISGVSLQTEKEHKALTFVKRGSQIKAK